jgi:tetratricopeptide (TPR) repeat protein
MAANEEVRYRVRVILDPTLNAFAYPHGSLYVHTGILARMENEDQLATVLGHEMTHVENRHMVRQQRAARNRAVGLTIAAVGALVLLEIAEIDALDDGHWLAAAHIDFFGQVIVDLGLQLAYVAAVNGYGRQLETEADVGAFAKLEAAGYDLREAPVVYEKLYEERGDTRRAEAFFFGSHPRLKERIADSRQYLSGRPAPAVAAGARDRTIFERRIRPVVREDARLNLEAGRLALAEDELARVRIWFPDDPELPWLEARLWIRQSVEEGDPERKRELRARAAEALHGLIRRDVDRPGPHRELGLLLYEDGDGKGACRELKHYLELDPDAEDAVKIDEYLAELRQDGHCH